MTKLAKVQARDYYRKGKPYCMLPNKINPNSEFGKYYCAPVNTKASTFDELESEFLYYNCSRETGRGITYYAID